MKKYSSFGKYQTLFESWRSVSDKPILEESLKDIHDAALKAYGQASSDAEKQKIKDISTITSDEIKPLEEGEVASMTPEQTKKRNEIFASLNPADFKKKDGNRWEEVMGAVATTTALGKK